MPACDRPQKRPASVQRGCCSTRVTNASKCPWSHANSPSRADVIHTLRCHIITTTELSKSYTPTRFRNWRNTEFSSPPRACQRPTRAPKTIFPNRFSAPAGCRKAGSWPAKNSTNSLYRKKHPRQLTEKSDRRRPAISGATSCRSCGCADFPAAERTFRPTRQPVRARRSEGLVYFSARRRIFQTNGWPKTWPRPFLGGPVTKSPGPTKSGWSSSAPAVSCFGRYTRKCRALRKGSVVGIGYDEFVQIERPRTVRVARAQHDVTEFDHVPRAAATEVGRQCRAIENAVRPEFQQHG